MSRISNRAESYWHSGKTYLVYQEHQGAVRSLCWSSDKKRIASGSDDQNVRIWYAR